MLHRYFGRRQICENSAVNFKNNHQGKSRDKEEESSVIIITADGSRMSGSHDHSGTAATEVFSPLSIFPLFRVPFLQVALRDYFYLYLSSPCVAATPHLKPPLLFPRHPSRATALSKSTRPPIHPRASQPPYRPKEDIIIIACLLFPSLPLAPSIRPFRPRLVRQSLRLWVIAVEWAGVW